MKLLFRSLLLLCMLASLPAAAQPSTGSRQARMSQLENAKIAYITERVSLTQDQAQRFWPVYNEYSAKRRELYHNMRAFRTDDQSELSEAQIKDNITKVFALRQQEVDLEKDYFNKFQKMLSVRQVGKLLQAERQFPKEVLRRVADRPGGPPTAPGTGAVN